MIILCLYMVGMVNEVAVVNAKFSASTLFSKLDKCFVFAAPAPIQVSEQGVFFR